MLNQWITDITRIRDQEPLSRLYLVFTAQSNDIQEIKYQCLLGKSDHIVTEVAMTGIEVNWDTAYTERHNYGRINFDALGKYFDNTHYHSAEYNEDRKQYA